MSQVGAWVARLGHKCGTLSHHADHPPCSAYFKEFFSLIKHYESSLAIIQNNTKSRDENKSPPDQRGPLLTVLLIRDHLIIASFKPDTLACSKSVSIAYCITMFTTLGTQCMF